VAKPDEAGEYAGVNMDSYNDRPNDRASMSDHVIKKVAKTIVGDDGLGRPFLTPHLAPNHIQIS
jgi:hypothetical protein